MQIKGDRSSKRGEMVVALSPRRRSPHRRCRPPPTRPTPSSPPPPLVGCCVDYKCNLF
jgi:hypothetical protein